MNDFKEVKANLVKYQNCMIELMRIHNAISEKLDTLEDAADTIDDIDKLASLREFVDVSHVNLRFIYNNHKYFKHHAKLDAPWKQII